VYRHLVSDGTEAFEEISYEGTIKKVMVMVYFESEAFDGKSGWNAEGNVNTVLKN